MNRNKIKGILLLDKPVGVTSNAALQSVKRIYNADKAGHTGSLDPLASGMLPICFGEATKFSQFLLEANKHYRVVGKLGVVTNTDDAEGEVLETKEVGNLTAKQIEQVLQKFSGEIEQLPSMFSAIKYQGQPLYKLARKGITVERQTRKVNIYKLELMNFANDLFELEVLCSKGTYVRTLVADIGKELGCGAHVVALRRLSVGDYQENQMVTMESLENLAKEQNFIGLNALLLPIASMMQGFNEVLLTETMQYYIKQGQAVMIPNAPAKGWVKMQNKQGQFLGVGEILPDGKIAPRKLL